MIFTKTIMKKRLTTVALLCLTMCLLTVNKAVAQTLDFGDQGDGTYKNPVLMADYSDPDVIRVGNKFYMVASDFHFMGMRVLESYRLGELENHQSGVQPARLSGLEQQLTLREARGLRLYATTTVSSGFTFVPSMRVSL